MTGRGLRLGRLAGISISAEIGVLFIGAFLAWSFSAGLLPAAVPGHVPLTYWSVGIVGAFAFLASLLGHEMAHSLVARRNGVEVEGITLWLFGGVASLKGDPPGPGAEFRIAAAGPAASLAIGAAFVGVSLALSAVGGPQVWVVMLAWLGLINGVLAVFNLLPGAPLDGGRILGSVLWKLRGDRVSGRLGAARVGRVIAWGLIGIGFAEIWFARRLTGLWTALIGWFLLNASRAEAAHYGAERAVTGLRVADAMLTPVQSATTWMTVEQVVRGPLAHSAQTSVPVVDVAGQARGLLFLERVKRVPAEQWSATTVVDVMEPISAVAVLAPGEPMSDALERIGTWGHAVVVDDHQEVVGLLGPAELRRVMELGGAAGPVRSPEPATPPPPPAVPRQHWQPPQPPG